VKEQPFIIVLIRSSSCLLYATPSRSAKVYCDIVLLIVVHLLLLLLLLLPLCAATVQG